MIKKRVSFLLIFALFTSQGLYSTARASASCIKNLQSRDWNFVENKGQVADNQIKYYGHQGAVSLYCRPGRISFIFAKAEKEPCQVSEATGSLAETQCLRLYRAPAIPQSPIPKDAFNASLQGRITICRADLILLNSNPSAQIIASNQQEYYENYYTTNTPEQGITNIHTYKIITYKNIYPFIDLVLHTKEQGMKYEFVVYPGGNISDIQIQWDGLEDIKKLKDSGIEYSCGLGDITESAPFSYVRAGLAPAPSAKIQKIPSQFILKNNLVSFKTDRYDKTKILVIDPVIDWATYFGGSVSAYSTSIALDNSQNIYITGTTNSPDHIATSGAYQTKYAGGSVDSENGGVGDALISKFSSKGNLIWSTYFGGPDDDIGNSIASDPSGNVVIIGTGTDTGLASQGAYQTSGYSPFSDPNAPTFVAKFSSSGIRLWSTYFAGSQGAQGLAIATDTSGNIFITGTTVSFVGIATSGAYQTYFAGSNSSAFNNYIGDAFLVKFSPAGHLLWGTYYGGEGDDEGMGITTDVAGNVFITGQTSSTYGIATAGAYQTSNSFTNPSEYDYQSFIAKFSNSGNLLWGTYFGGKSGNAGTSIAVDRSSGSIYIFGYAYSDDSGLTSPGAFQTSAYSSYGNVFLARFSTSGSRAWCTYFGGGGSELTTYGNDVAVDPSGNAWITSAMGTALPIATQGAYQTSYRGNGDAFLAEFGSGGNRIWSTFYGGAGEDAGNGVAVDGTGNVYVTGSTKSASGISTSGAFQTAYSGIEDAFITKFKTFYHDPGIASIISPVHTTCTGNQIVKVLLKNFGTLDLDSAAIGWTVNGQLQKPIQWAGKLLPDSSTVVALNPGLFAIGIDSVKAWTSMPNGVFDSIPGNDTAYIVLNVNPFPIANIGQSTYSICTGTHIKIGANAQPSYVYAWSSVPVGFSSTLADPVVNPASNTVYDLTVTDTLTGCTNTNSANVSVSILQAPVVNAGSNQSICMGVSAQIGSSAQSGDTYSWASNPAGFVSTMANPVVTPVQATSYSLTVTNTNGCTNFDSVIITINPRPQPVISSPQNICSQTAIQLGGTPTAGYSYQWTSKPTGFNSNISNPIDSPYVSTTYYLKETISATGCADSDSVKITVVPRPNVTFDVKYLGGFEYGFTVNSPNYPSSRYHWVFNDPLSGKPDTASGIEVSHVYSQNGNYNAVLTIALPMYCTETDSDLVIVNESFSLNIFPNPFNLQTNIQYLLTSPGHVKISMTDEIGRNIGTLLDRQLAQGEYNTLFDGAAWKTRPGMYFIIFQLDDKVIVKKTVQIDSIYY